MLNSHLNKLSTSWKRLVFRPFPNKTKHIKSSSHAGEAMLSMNAIFWKILLFAMDMWRFNQFCQHHRLSVQDWESTNSLIFWDTKWLKDSSIRFLTLPYAQRLILQPTLWTLINQNSLLLRMLKPNSSKPEEPLYFLVYWELFLKTNQILCHTNYSKPATASFWTTNQIPDQATLEN